MTTPALTIEQYTSYHHFGSSVKCVFCSSHSSSEGTERQCRHPPDRDWYRIHPAPISRTIFSGTLRWQVSISPTFYLFYVLAVWVCNFFVIRKLVQKLIVKCWKCWWNWLKVSVSSTFFWHFLKKNVLRSFKFLK